MPVCFATPPPHLHPQFPWSKVRAPKALCPHNVRTEMFQNQTEHSTKTLTQTNHEWSCTEPKTCSLLTEVLLFNPTRSLEVQSVYDKMNSPTWDMLDTWYRFSRSPVPQPWNLSSAIRKLTIFRKYCLRPYRLDNKQDEIWYYRYHTPTHSKPSYFSFSKSNPKLFFSLNACNLL